MTWRKRPIIYEIATWVWLEELRSRYREPLTLATIPAQEWDALADLSIDAVWLMGVWERSPAGVAVSNANTDLQAEFHRVLPDYRSEDNLGSAYCVRDYVVDAHLGGPDALRQARAELSARGRRLVLDFVPNHVAMDHSWALRHPEYFIHGNYEDLTRARRRRRRRVKRGNSRGARGVRPPSERRTGGPNWAIVDLSQGHRFITLRHRGNLQLHSLDV